MAGLNFGYTYKLKKQKFSIGVNFAPIINKWVVCSYTKTNTFTTLAKFDSEIEAQIYYKNLYLICIIILNG